MFTGQVRYLPHGISVAITYPGNHTGPTIQASTEGEARRQIYFECRAYMVTKLISWLEQRMHARAVGQRRITKESAELLVVLRLQRNTGFLQVCKEVAAKVEGIYSVAPPVGSREYAYYQKFIEPIAVYCKTEIAKL